MVINHGLSIVSDVLKGRGQFAAEWMLVAQKIKENSRWVLKPMNYSLNYFGNGPVEITKQGNFKIGRKRCKEKEGIMAGKQPKCFSSKLIRRNYSIVNRKNLTTTF